MNRKIDYTALKVNQACIIALLILAFLLNQVWLVVFVTLVMLVGTWWPQAGLFKLLYARGLKPAGLLKPELVVDEAQPHLFAQGVGGIFLMVSVLAFALGSAWLGWALAGIVVVLAAVNLFLGFCVGCFMYFQLERRGIHVTLPGWQSM